MVKASHLHTTTRRFTAHNEHQVDDSEVWVPETVHTARDLPFVCCRWPGMIRWWRCVWVPRTVHSV